MTGASALRIVSGVAEGNVLASAMGLSFWGGVDPVSACVIDTHHPLQGKSVAGAVLMMPTSRGSCSGSGVMLDLALNGKAPAAMIFSEAEDILTLGALIAGELFECGFPVLQVSNNLFETLAKQSHLKIEEDVIIGDELRVQITSAASTHLALSDEDQAILNGRDGPAAALSMEIICTVARQQGATQLTDIKRGHIDGCIYAHPANLIFAEKMDEMGAKVRVPTTINAISVDRMNWQTQGVPTDFGSSASRLADAYVRMGCEPTFTCAPYLLNGRPQLDEAIAWAESNAVIYANSVLGARTPKHPDYLDLCIAVTGRAPLSGVYLDEERRAKCVLDIEVPQGASDAIWPLIGYIAGLKSPDRIPLLRGLAALEPHEDDLKALCAAFGTTSAAPMLHVEGVTPEAGGAALDDAEIINVTHDDFVQAWRQLNDGPEAVDLIAIGSPHASLRECQMLAKALNGQKISIATIVTAGRGVIALAKADGTWKILTDAGVQIIPDLCWCSITEPIFPPKTRAVMTNSGKYAHYGPGLSGRAMRFGSTNDCAAAAISGSLPTDLPDWLK